MRTHRVRLPETSRGAGGRTRPAAVLAAAVLAVLAVAPAAAAAPARAVPATVAVPGEAAGNPVDAAVAAFRGGDHLYVDPAQDGLTPDDVARVRAAVDHARTPIYLAVLPTGAAPGGAT